MRVLFVASECFPYIKTGGLADAASALAVALRNAGIDVQVMLPAYSQLKKQHFTLRQMIKLPPLPGVKDICLAHYIDRETGVPLWLVECPEVYDFEGGIYADSTSASGHETARRFGVLGWAAAQLSISSLASWKPDIVHMHDWHASLANLYLDRFGKEAPASLLTIHNLAFQGCFPIDVAKALGIEAGELAFGGDTNAISFLGEAISRSKKITTVSPNYAKEILKPEFGCGFDHLLHQRRGDIVGILNGVDYQTWCPELDPHLPLQGSQFDAAARMRCRNELQSKMSLDITQRTPILAFTNRLTEQKMVDIILEAMPTLLERNVQVVIHGQGEYRFEKALEDLSRRCPRQLAVCIGHDQSLEHLIHAGSDICLSPSRFEPCGLNPLYAMRYGAVPIARAVGGIVDSLVDANDMTIARGTANGFIFHDVQPTDLIAAIDRALSYFGDRQAWQKIRLNGNRRQFRWQNAADQYIDVYKSLFKSGDEKTDDDKWQHSLLSNINCDHYDSRIPA